MCTGEPRLFVREKGKGKDAETTPALSPQPQAHEGGLPSG
jgi:hypothetical protein